MNAIAIDELIDNYLKNNEIHFELRAVKKDGEVVAKYSSGISADDVSGYAGLLDEKIMQLAIEENNDRHEYMKEAQAEDAMERLIEARS